MQSKQAGVARQRACHSLHIISLHHPRIENHVDCTYTTIILQWCVGVACLPQRQTRIPMQFLGPSCTHTETSGCCPSASARFPWFQSYMRGYLKNYTEYIIYVCINTPAAVCIDGKWKEPAPLTPTCQSASAVHLWKLAAVAPHSLACQCWVRFFLSAVLITKIKNVFLVF